MSVLYYFWNKHHIQANCFQPLHAPANLLDTSSGFTSSGATCQRGAGQTLDMKSNLCPSSVQCLSKLCPTSVQVQGLSSRCPGQVHSLSRLCLRSVHLQTPWTGIGHTDPVFVQFLSSRRSKMFYFSLDKLWTNIVWAQTPYSTSSTPCWTMNSTWIGDEENIGRCFGN